MLKIPTESRIIIKSPPLLLVHLIFLSKEKCLCFDISLKILFKNINKSLCSHWEQTLVQTQNSFIKKQLSSLNIRNINMCHNYWHHYSFICIFLFYLNTPSWLQMFLPTPFSQGYKYEVTQRPKSLSHSSQWLKPKNRAVI